MDHQWAVDRNLIEGYVLGELEEAELVEFEEHLFECAACAEELREITALAANLRAVLGEEDGTP